jgi:hypothetical protein
MAKAVLVTKIGSIYDHLPEERYHFPLQYLGRMKTCVGDWIIYYEPGRLTGESARRPGRRRIQAMWFINIQAAWLALARPLSVLVPMTMYSQTKRWAGWRVPHAEALGSRN